MLAKQDCITFRLGDQETRRNAHWCLFQNEEHLFWYIDFHYKDKTVVSQAEGPCTLQWRHNGRDSVSNHQPHDCLLNCSFRCRSKKTSKLRVAGLWAGNSSGTGEFPAQMASYAENVSIWWRHHEERLISTLGLGPFQHKDHVSRYRDFYDEDKMVVMRPSYNGNLFSGLVLSCLHNGNS